MVSRGWIFTTETEGDGQWPMDTRGAMGYKEPGEWAGRHEQEREQETNKGTRTGEYRQPTNAGQQHHTSRNQHTTPSRATVWRDWHLFKFEGSKHITYHATETVGPD